MFDRGRYVSRRSTVFARNLVAASQPLATQAGLRMLLKGGNAVDAALASAITLTVVEPTGNGLGSDAFAIVADRTEVHGLNASGRSPAALDRSRLAKLSAMPKRGWDSVTVPGAVAAWRDLSERFGKLAFAELFEPAVDYADRGFIISPVIAEVWRRAAEDLKEQPGYAETFMPDGRAPRAGEVFVNKPLARTLRLIAETSGEAFYRGDLAEKISDFAAQHSAAITMDDMARHENDWCGTITQNFGDATLHEIPPNGQGIAALMAIGILQFVGLEQIDPDSGEALHLEIEAMKIAFADVHRFVGDPAHMTVSPESLLDSAYLAERAQLIDRRKAQSFGAGAPRFGGTVCLSAGDASGMMISYIQSNFVDFGSGIVVPQTGISLQNRAFGFTLKPGHPNEAGPGKRPFHTIIPGFVTRHGEPHMAFGLMGGPMQAQGHVQMFVRTQIWGQDPRAAADAPRWRYETGLRVAVEPGYPNKTIELLVERGHDVVMEAFDVTFGFGGAQLVARLPNSAYVAGSDPRKDGLAAGF